jgi:transposase-like protein
MRNLLEKAPKCDYDEVKAGDQASYLAENQGAGRSRIRQVSLPLETHLSRSGEAGGPRLAGVAVDLRVPSAPVAQTALHHVIERCFVEVRRRTRPMVCCGNVESVDPEVQPGMENPHP